MQDCISRTRLRVGVVGLGVVASWTTTSSSTTSSRRTRGPSRPRWGWVSYTTRRALLPAGFGDMQRCGHDLPGQDVSGGRREGGAEQRDSPLTTSRRPPRWATLWARPALALHLHNKGVEQDYKKALDYFKKASDQIWVEGQLHLGTIFYHGWSV